MRDLSLVQLVIVWSIPVLFAITLHEVAHGWAALRLGDRTAQFMGRLTLNPVRHIDPVGTLLVPAILLVLPTPFIFGWAKPVPIAERNLGHPRRDMALVAVAGPAANILMALGWAAVGWLGVQMGDAAAWMSLLIYMGAAGVAINLLLAIFNLLPIPPLDGGRVLMSLVPPRWSGQLGRVEPYGIFIVLGLILLGAMQYLLWYPLLMVANGLGLLPWLQLAFS